MNFMESVKAMKEGKKVRKSTYLEKRYKYYERGRLNYSDGSNWEDIDLADIEATDWEIYWEKKTLSDKEKMFFSGAIVDIEKGKENEGVLITLDVKEALKELKRRTMDKDFPTKDHPNFIFYRDMLDAINEIFGERLIENG